MPKELDEELTQLNYMEKLAIINANIKHLVDYYDDNNMMDMGMIIVSIDYKAGTITCRLIPTRE